MRLQIKFVGAEANEQTPNIALYSLDIRGQAQKIAASKDGQLNLETESFRPGALIALGPDVADPSTLDSKSLITYNAAAQLSQWDKNPVLEIPAQLWRPWLPIRICLTGTVSKCYPFVLDKISLLRSIALGNTSIALPWRDCAPVCNGVVEIWESNCCCFPFLLEDVPPFIEKLRTFLARNPLMFPAPPRPGAAPASRAQQVIVDRAIATGNADLRFVPNTQLSQDLQALESSSPADAVTYFQAHPSLWRIWCSCSSSKLSETPLNPDGSFQYCYDLYLLLWPFCGRSYFYKVKQWVGGSWVYIYDGSAANQYFSADETANLSTFLGNACGGVQPPPGTDFVILQQIGGTLSYALHSNYGGVDMHNDLTQTGQYSVQPPPPNGGLVNDNNAPWCKSPSFMLYFDPGMKTLGACYYRFSVAPADLNGNPVGAMQPILNPVAWLQYVFVEVGGQTEVDIVPVTLGPNAAGLYQIPYNADADWLPGQFHQYYDTTTLNAAASGVPGPGNGRFLLAVEIFDKNGNRLVPIPAAAGSGDTQVAFQYLRMTAPPGPGSTANVPQAALTHLFWADNRHVIGEIDYFSLNGLASNAQCQFLSGTGSDSFQVGYRAYHAVLSDPAPNPLPPTSFMESFSLTWERGLNGPQGTFDSGGDTDMPSTRASGPPQPSPAANGLLSNLLPAPIPPATSSSCSFAIDLYVTSKHTDGSSHFDDLDWNVPAAVALSLNT